MASPQDDMPVTHGPELRLETISNLCSLGPRPWVANALIQGIIEMHFGDPRNIEDPSLQDLVWAPDGSGNILIEQITRWTPLETESRPAVIIKRNSWQSVRLGLNNENMGNFAIDGYTRYTRLHQGSHTIFCLAGESGEADRLATEIMILLLEYGPIIAQQLNMMRFEFAEYGEIMELQEATENFAVPLTVAYAFQQNWVIKPDAPKLKRIMLSTSALTP